MQVKTYLGKMRVRIGEYENDVSVLLVANSAASATELLDSAAALYYGEGDEPFEDEGYYANGGEVHVKPLSTREIGLATFLEMKTLLTVRCQHNVVVPTSELLSESVQTATKQLLTALQAREVPLTQSVLLHALAASWGEKNWQVLKAKISAPDKVLFEALRDAAREVFWSADNEGCSDDLTVASASAIEKLDEVLDQIDEQLKL